MIPANCWKCNAEFAFGTNSAPNVIRGRWHHFNCLAWARLWHDPGAFQAEPVNLAPPAAAAIGPVRDADADGDFIVITFGGGLPIGVRANRIAI